MIATTRPFAPFDAPSGKQRDSPQTPPRSSYREVGERSEKRERRERHEGRTGRNAEDASNQPDHAEAERRMERRSDGIGNVPRYP